MEGTRIARIESIDLMRGAVIVLMALDHVRMYFGQGTWWAKPTNLDTTTPLSFFTRWITHFCAPVFIFLAGTSDCLYRERHQGTRQLSRYLFKRGLWLIFLELVIVNLGWTFDITFSFHFLQVIWALGASMVILAGLVYLPTWAILACGLFLVFGHNLLDPIQMEGTSIPALIWYILHQNVVVAFGPNAAVYFHYPLIPLVGLMALGYVSGALYRTDYGAGKRQKWLLWTGTAAILLFLILRGLNLYGDPNPWSRQPTVVYSIMSFLNTTKYPASLHFLLMTIGPVLVFLALTEGVSLTLTNLIIPQGAGTVPAWIKDNSWVVYLALNLVPFAGISFLWFKGVARDRMGSYEDRFFATVFMGTGFLYLGIIFVATALAYGLIAAYRQDNSIVTSTTYSFGIVVIDNLTFVFGSRMAAAFMIISATLWLHTKVMSRWLALLTYLLALVLLFVISVSSWVILIFPSWMLLVSLILLAPSDSASVGDHTAVRMSK